MSNTLFVVTLAGLAAALMNWAFRALPKEHWQFIASVPIRKTAAGQWTGRNLTYYGFFQANACTLGAALMLVLMSCLAVPVGTSLAMLALVLGICLPASKVIARLVERQRHTFTVGGASFVGFLIVPILFWCVGGATGVDAPLVAMLAATVVCYTIAEGIGRLACISFGCCYGKRVEQCRPLLRKAFTRWGTIFCGHTKKASYESGCDGQRLVPIQIITSIVLTTNGLGGLWLFLDGRFLAVLALTMPVTQVWRFISEFLRADYRGARKVSMYQIMALSAVAYWLAIAWFAPAGGVPPIDVTRGLAALWGPLPIVFLQCLWLAVFLFTGRSQVTSGTLSFDVNQA